VPALKNAKHEAFAQGLHIGLSQADAYEQAGFTRNQSSAGTLARTPEVAQRVEELNRLEDNLSSVEEDLTEKVMQELINPTNVSHAWLTIQLYRNCILARSLGEVGAANKALELIGKTKGLFDNPDLPADVRKQLQNGKSVGTLAGSEERLSEVARFAGLLGKSPGDFVETEDAVECVATEVFDGADRDE
jgi:hypothetical protein